MNCLRLTALFVSVTVLGSCDDTATWEARRALPEDVQRAAYAECSKELRLTHWLHLNKLKSRDGLLHVLGSDGSGVIVAEAHQLNQCAWGKLDAINAKG